MRQDRSRPSRRSATLATTCVSWRRSTDFVKSNIRYTGDITFKDTFQSAYRTLQYGGGDCDDHAGLNAVLAMENGFQTKFRITSNTGASWDHIYCVGRRAEDGPSEVGHPRHDAARTEQVQRVSPYAKFKDFDVDEQ